ncbi:hypothetical protein ADU37_CDS11120 [Thermococcus sp. 2319x1]|uniref:hypothetical protein n=1 Tax=Thermococcus sp. 2319x1 TaxID=1674923 RepID=UPI00073A68E4|nr:hypothetical protein [Thermococcus sp. 2319x1]ALV62811.1 hypothetical protein ADU37_CDS11120 [Thermococcus sp. 2319x1]
MESKKYGFFGIGAKYPSLVSLAVEILKAKAKEACITRSNFRPFIRENQKTGELELIIPVASLSKLEKCVLEAVGFPKRPVRVGDTMIIAIVVGSFELGQIDQELMQMLRTLYYTLTC